MGIPSDFLDDSVDTPYERRCTGCGERKPQSYLDADLRCRECNHDADEGGDHDLSGGFDRKERLTECDDVELGDLDDDLVGRLKQLVYVVECCGQRGAKIDASRHNMVYECPVCGHSEVI